MEEQDWNYIIEELTEQLKITSLERAVARADVRKAVKMLADRDEKIRNLEEQVRANNTEVEIQTAKAK